MLLRFDVGGSVKKIRRLDFGDIGLKVLGAGFSEFHHERGSIQGDILVALHFS